MCSTSSAVYDLSIGGTIIDDLLLRIRAGSLLKSFGLYGKMGWFITILTLAASFALSSSASLSVYSVLLSKFCVPEYGKDSSAMYGRVFPGSCFSNSESFTFFLMVFSIESVMASQKIKINKFNSHV